MKYQEYLKWALYTIALYISLIISFYYSSVDVNLISLLIAILLAPAIGYALSKPPLKAKIYLVRIYIYLLLGVCFTSLFYGIIEYLGITKGESVNYALSTLIQCEAAIIAIVITLTLIAVQHTASSYSTRIIDIFKNQNIDLTILLFIYISSIIYSLYVLIYIDNAKNFDDIKPYIYFAFSYGLFALIALFPYFTFTLNLLKPSVIIDYLAEDITKNNLELSNNEICKCISKKIKSLEDAEKYSSYSSISRDTNPIQPIFDIIVKSLFNYDYPTVQNGVSKIVDQMLIIYHQNTKKQCNSLNESSKIINKLLHSCLSPLARISIKNDHEPITTYVILELFRVSMVTSDNEDSQSTQNIVLELERIGKYIIDSKFFYSYYVLLCGFLRLKITSPILEIDIGEKIENLISSGRATGCDEFNKAIDKAFKSLD